MLTNEEQSRVTRVNPQDSTTPTATTTANNGMMKETSDDCSHDRKELEVDEADVTNLNSLSSQFATSSMNSATSGMAEISNVMLANSKSLLESNTNNNRQSSTLISSTIDEAKNEMPLSFSSINVANPSDKIWSLIDTVSSDDLNSQTYADSISGGSFSEQPTIHKVQSQPLMKRTISGGGAANYNHSLSSLTSANQLVTSPNSSLYNSSPNGLNSKNYSNMNWPGMSQVQTTMPSSMAWSANNFNAAAPSSAGTAAMNTFTTSPNSMQNSWSNGIYGNNQKQRMQMANQNPNTSLISTKKSLYSNDNQSMLESNHKMPRNSSIQYKEYSNSSNVYELGSAGSDNTSSSSDSANLRQNGLLHLQDRANDSIGGPLDSIRYSLEPQLLDIMRNNSAAAVQDSKAINFNFPYQGGAQDDKKPIKGRNFGRRRGKSPFFTGNDSDALFADFPTSSNENNERFSRKVFVGGLPPDIDEEEITASFRRYGPLVVDWPHKAESKSYFPPKGYAFLLFQDESSVQTLIDACIQEDDKLYLCVSSPTIKDKPVQIRPWRLSDADYVLDASMPLDPRKTVFVGGVPRPLKAIELAMIMDRLYGGVCYAGIDTDPELKYPKGAGRVAFSNQQSYIAAISARFVHLQHADIEKRVEVKPYVLDDQICDECQGARCGGKFAPYFCANITCLQYYCENCWATIHSRPGREFHKPLVKEGADRPRAVPFRWC